MIMFAMREFGVADKNIVTEKQSEKNLNRPRHQRLVEELHAGDVLVIQSIDRLCDFVTVLID